MGASRRYSRSQANYSRLSAWNASGQKTFSLEDSNYSRIEAYTESQNRKTEKANREGTSKASEQTDTENEKTETGLSQNGKMNDLIEQMQSSSNIRRSTVQERLDALTQIRQKTLSYLLYILFGRGIPGTDGASTGASTTLIFITANRKPPALMPRVLRSPPTEGRFRFRSAWKCHVPSRKWRSTRLILASQDSVTLWSST